MSFTATSEAEKLNDNNTCEDDLNKHFYSSIL